MKRTIIFTLAFMACVTFASAEVYNGTCGTALTWSLNTEDSTLTISGSGDMDLWNYAGAPWYGYKSFISKVVLPEGLTNIGDYAFYECDNLISITIPNTVKSIGYCGFCLCSNLPSIEIPNSVTSIGAVAFEGCESLKSAALGSNITSIGEQAFCTCRVLTSIVLPEGLTTIEDMVFGGCPKLTSVNIPTSVTTIKQQAFSDCTSLLSLEIPSSVINIGESAFASVPNIIYHGSDPSLWGAKCRNGHVEGYVVYTDETRTTVAACSAAAQTGVVLANSVTTINPWAFGQCYDLPSVELPEGLTTIGNYAFYECRGICSLTIPSTVTSVGEYPFINVANVVYSGPLDTYYWGAKYMNGYVDGYFVYTDDTKTTLAVCSNAARGNITVPNTVTTIMGRAFVWCTNITSVTIPSTVTSYGDNLFGACMALESVQLPSNITQIPEYMFNGSAIKHMDIPESVTSIGEYAFGWCDNLRSVSLPKKVGLKIGSNAFSSCRRLQTITCKSIIPPTIDASDDIFYEVDKATCILYVPEQSIEVYRSAYRWGEFYNILPIKDAGPTDDYTIYYIDKDDGFIDSEIVTLNLPEPPVFSGFKFVKWQVVAGDLVDGITIQAAYKADAPTTAPEIVTNPSYPAQKLIRNGSVYILTDDSRTYTLTGQQVK